ncbi:hypothetical protein [Nafulsella turpanensis]|uniref:hypothetical protein n=1 Tax=Nafulsella turpanensis TaxID=1265690 RepID=UPI00034D995E|nr:hypothetical protein [Nafulsella turpanensis]
MSEMNRLLFGDEYADKMETFNKQLLEIENKYLDYFKSQESGNDYEEYDRLHNHYIIHTDGPAGRISFNIMKDSTLPERIKRDCYQAFERTWGN